MGLVFSKSRVLLYFKAICRLVGLCPASNSFFLEMAKIILKARDLKIFDFPKDSLKTLALGVLNRHFKFLKHGEQLDVLANVLKSPTDFAEDPLWKTFVEQLQGKQEEVKEDNQLIEPQPFRVYGRQHIAANAYQQMVTAMTLPVSVAGALMPDAHYGYGLPIGGVLATSNAVIPYGVGVDIGCRMALSIFADAPNLVTQKAFEIKQAIGKFTHFGTEGGVEFHNDHEVLSRPEFGVTELLRKLHKKAHIQLGSSGTGNHFVEFGTIELNEANSLGLPAGQYSALLTHSGSRGLGANVAMHYTKIAMDKRNLPSHARSLAWLSLDEEAGQEYWLSMNLAGDYAKANHDCIHQNMANFLGVEVLAKVENHHNFAWKEQHLGRELIVHRKGATPASKGELGIIPGSMATSCYLVSGKGCPEALRSASHGAGRLHSRKEAMESISKKDMMQFLDKQGVTLIGGSREEAPQAYKDIEKIMQCQQDLVNIEGQFYPKIVRMYKE